jgi:polysaccharide deacetylase family protein (PEP-CTERM system associated)
MTNSSAPITDPDLATTRPGKKNQVKSSPGLSSVPVVLSFDVEQHDRIEAAVGLEIDTTLKGDYDERMKRMTQWILEQLAQRNVVATFFILGQIGADDPGLVRGIHEAGHEVASHGWNHRRIHDMNPETFREDVRKSRDALEQACGAEVVGYRAPTFSVVRKTAWALDVLAELGILYDSSIYPVRHDRYGISDAPRGPFIARGSRFEILEIPPATLRFAGVNVPVGGGGYFRLLPLPLTKLALSLSRRDSRSGATVLYFHPWEFDPNQPRLPLKGLNRFRTYVGIRYSQRRLSRLLSGYTFVRAVDLARQLQEARDTLPRFRPDS